MPRTQLIAFFELLFAAALWGFGFIAAIWTLESFSPLGITASRFVVAALAGCVIMLFPRLRSGFQKREFLSAAIPGILISGVLILQTWGLKYTSATNSSFITTLYVVIVPLFEMAILRRKLHPLHGVFVLVALVGTGLIVGLQFDQFNWGDLLTLLCAIIAAFHIFYLGLISSRIQNAFAFNTFQSFWAGLLALIFIPLIDGPHFMPITNHAIIGLCSLAFGSTLIAFFLQVKAQKVLSPSLSSLLFLMESPFATMFAVVILHETISGMQAWGALLIFAAALGASIYESKK